MRIISGAIWCLTSIAALAFLFPGIHSELLARQKKERPRIGLVLSGKEAHKALLGVVIVGAPRHIHLKADLALVPQLADAGLGYRYLDGTAGGLLRAMRASRPGMASGGTT